MFTYQLDEHAYLKLLEIMDCEALFELTDQSRDHLRTWLPWVDDTKTVEHSKAFIQSTMKKFADNNGFDAGIWYKDQLAGVIGFHFISWPNRSTSIGYWMGKRFQGLGLMTKATKAMVDYAINDLNLNRVEIRVAVENQKSRAIPERLGFKNEGTLRQCEWLYDHYVDHVVYSMLKEDWNQIKQNS
ncbi:MAG: GNAT family N-acetyltransferase [Bacillaceae bacterium]|nr:GNAT family N-acetyltransferase [Bacillaceae bacterium]